MELFVQLTQWTEYMSAQLAAAEVDEKAINSRLEILRAKSAVANSGAKTVTAAKAKVYEDEAFIAASEEALTVYAYRKMVEALYGNTDRKASLISRELTRRVGREPRESRRDRYTT